MVKPTLLVLAAGMGSRYGSLKQMDGVGPHREAIIDYSIYDAIRAGFGKVVFVIRHSFDEEFREVFNAQRFGGKIQVEYVYQELDALPAAYVVPEGRQKPWGTNHAIMMAAAVIHEPFAVVNADDFYGADAFRVIGNYLSALENAKNDYCMVAYDLGKTLSENGTVSRGECTVSAENFLVKLEEHTQIERNAEGVIVFHEGAVDKQLAENTPVSMNLFGFTPDYFDYSEAFFKDFLRENYTNLKAEYYIPSAINRLIAERKATLRVLRSSAQWFGVTYKEDRAPFIARIGKLIEQGVYPADLWA
ncbi:MAG: sugar phosphate nucleotidyltransferase [Alistipes sp.]